MAVHLRVNTGIVSGCGGHGDTLPRSGSTEGLTAQLAGRDVVRSRPEAPAPSRTATAACRPGDCAPPAGPSASPRAGGSRGLQGRCSGAARPRIPARRGRLSPGVLRSGTPLRNVSSSPLPSCVLTPGKHAALKFQLSICFRGTQFYMLVINLEIIK